jgi:hypothetical protein
MPGKINAVDNPFSKSPPKVRYRPFFEDVAPRSGLGQIVVLREWRTNGARLSISTSVFGANLSTTARQTPSFLRAAVAVSSTTCFGDFQPANTVGFYGPRFSELRYTP